MDYRRYAIDELRAVNELRAAERVCLDRLIELDEQLRALKARIERARKEADHEKTHTRYIAAAG